jgi:3-hydroxypropanoate dehydrogenase
MSTTTDHSQHLAIDPASQALLFTEARTANAFGDEAVTDEQLHAIYSLWKWAPTSGNSNSTRWLVVRSPEAKARLLPHMSEGNRQKTGSAPATIVIAADLDFHDNLPALVPYNPDARAMFADDVARREAMSRDMGWLQAAYFIVCVRAAGLAAGPMIGFDPAGVDAEFLGDTSWRSIVVVNVGKPAAEGAWFDRLPRLSYDEAVREA